LTRVRACRMSSAIVRKRVFVKRISINCAFPRSKRWTRRMSKESRPPALVALVLKRLPCQGTSCASIFRKTDCVGAILSSGDSYSVPTIKFLSACATTTKYSGGPPASKLIPDGHAQLPGASPAGNVRLRRRRKIPSSNFVHHFHLTYDTNPWWPACDLTLSSIKGMCDRV
jgi:hypothetical protein